MRIIYYFIAILFCIIFRTGYSQNNNSQISESNNSDRAFDPISPITRADDGYFSNQRDFLPTNPDAYILANDITASSDKYTGIATITVPIYNIPMNNKSLPIYLGYYASGLRLNDKPSIVGVGWSLHVGGKIMRVVRGIPDRFDQLKESEDPYTWSASNFVERSGSNWDTQSDLYYFELPNSSGSFVFDSDQKIHTIPFQNVKIEFSEDKFKIYDEAGNCYYFNTTEMSNEGQYGILGSVRYISSWFLDKIEYLNGDVVNFNYTTGSDYTYRLINYYNNAVVTCDNSGNKIDYKSKSEKNISISTTIKSAQYLSSISYDNQEVSFYYDTLRNDYNGLKRLTTIKVNAKGESKAHKTYSLKYSNFPNKDLKLDSLIQTGQMGGQKPICSFEYYEDVVLPERGSYNFDHWGFCNANTKYPLKRPAIELTCDFDSNFPKGLVVNGQSRSSILEFTRAQSLKQIIFPNGGTKELVYELQNGKNLTTLKDEDAGGLRIKKVIEKESPSASPSITEYSYKGGCIVDDIKNYLLAYDLVELVSNGSFINRQYGFRISSRISNPSVDYWGSTVVYSEVTEHLPNGSSIKYEYVPMSECKDLLPKVFYLSGTATITPGGSELNGFTPKTSLSWARFLLKRKTLLDAKKLIVEEHTFEYKVDSSKMVCIPGHVAYENLKYTIDIGNYSQSKFLARRTIGEYYTVSCPVLMHKHTIHKGKYNLPQGITYEYNGDGLLSKLTMCNSDGSVYTQKITYAQDFDITDTTKVIGRLKQRNARIPIETITYKDGQIYSAIGNSYRFNETNPNAIVLDCKRSGLEQKRIDSLTFKPVNGTASGFVFDNKYLIQELYSDYSSSGKLLSFLDKQGIYHSYVHLPYTTQPMAVVHNARYSQTPNVDNQVFFTDFEDANYNFRMNKGKSGQGVFSTVSINHFTLSPHLTPGTYTLSYWYLTKNDPIWTKYSESINISSKDGTLHIMLLPEAVAIDDLSILPRNSIILSSAYIPGLGNLSETNERGYTVYCEYNEFGLPEIISDDQNIVIKRYEYK